MKRLAPLLVLGALALAASACDLSPPAATVDGTTVTRSQLDAQLQTASGSPAAQCALEVLAEQNGSSLPTVAGSGDDTVTTQFAAYELTGLVRQAIERRGLAEHHATVGSADLAAARQDYLNELTAAAQSSTPCGLSGSALVQRLPKAFVDQEAALLADDERLEEVAGHIDVSPAGLYAYYQSHQFDVTEECLDIIVATSQSAAQTIHNTIAAGTSFAVADQGPGVNPNGPTDAEEPCVFPATIESQLGPQVAAVVATLGVGQVANPLGVTVTDPTTGQPSTVWIVLGVRQRQLAPFAGVESGIRLELLQQGQAALDAALERLGAGMRVDVDPRYGAWTTKQGVVPPTAPPSSFVLNPSAGSSSGTSSLGALGG